MVLFSWLDAYTVWVITRKTFWRCQMLNVRCGNEMASLDRSTVMFVMMWVFLSSFVQSQFAQLCVLYSSFNLHFYLHTIQMVQYILKIQPQLFPRHYKHAIVVQYLSVNEPLLTFWRDDSLSSLLTHKVNMLERWHHHYAAVCEATM